MQAIVELKKAEKNSRIEAEKLRALMPGDVVKVKISRRKGSVTFKLRVQGVGEIDGEQLVVAYLDTDGMSFTETNHENKLVEIGLTNNNFIGLSSEGESVLAGTFIEDNGKKQLLVENAYVVTWQKL